MKQLPLDCPLVIIIFSTIFLTVSNGKKELIHNNDIYDSVDYYLRYIVGKTIGDLTEKDKIIRCVPRSKNSTQQ